MRRTMVWLPVWLMVSAALGAQARAATECADLAMLVLPDTVISAVERIDSGKFTIPSNGNVLDVPPTCRVVGTISPAVKFEVWLPEDGTWNGRFQAVGGGGLAGIISYPALAQAVRDGYASASTNTGHEASDSSWLADRQRLIDYGYRAIHETAVKAKAIIDARYGEAPAYSYFNGCSTGGRQGLMEAQRYPHDFDGIVSGAPVNTFTHLHIGQLWTAHATLKTPGAVLSADDMGLISDAVLAQCDALDGVEDGILTDPRVCNFDPGKLQCNSGQSDLCLNPAQVDAVRMIYQGAVNPRTGAQIYPGLEPGSEAAQPNNRGWSLIMNGTGPFGIDQAVIGGMTFENPDYDWRDFDFDEDVEIVDAKLFGVLNAVDADLRDFKAQGGKLIVYHGWNDPGVMPQQTINYFDRVVDFASQATGSDGAQFTDEYMRLFMMPGMGHCRGGSGPDNADFMAAISAWVERDEAPAQIIASKLEGGEVTMSRPLCPHPQAARYRGRGDTDTAASFECALPE